MLFCIIGPKVLFKKGKNGSVLAEAFMLSYYKQGLERRIYG